MLSLLPITTNSIAETILVCNKHGENGKAKVMDEELQPHKVVKQTIP
jgi:hypothetical protein